uniref:Putative secreted protein ovary overexpressed n=1 Tax=Rhipicephalus microplus TaxID=6941 RepID=A0A6M2DBB3_RHIMP
MRKQETMIGILLLIPAVHVVPDLPEARSLAQLPSQPGFSATSAEFSRLEMSPLDNQPITASPTTRAAHWDLEIALAPDKERINSG